MDQGLFLESFDRTTAQEIYCLPPIEFRRLITVSRWLATGPCFEPVESISHPKPSILLYFLIITLLYLHKFLKCDVTTGFPTNFFKINFSHVCYVSVSDILPVIILVICVQFFSCSCFRHPTVFSFFPLHIARSVQKILRTTCANLHLSLYRRTVALLMRWRICG